MSKSVTLDIADWGQIVDGLTARAASYEETADYLSGVYNDLPAVIEEVKDETEARSIAALYRCIVAMIEGQL